MDPIRNPYTPGAGSPPPELAGRDELREQMRAARPPDQEHLDGRFARCWQDRAARPDTRRR